MTTTFDASPSPLSPAASAPPPRPRTNLVIEYTVRWKWTFFILVAVLQFSAWNGYWRVSRDSALYRSVAQNLAQGRGYTFRGEVEKHAFPGLPLMLAGLDKAFPTKDSLRPVPALATIFVMGLLTLVMVYRLVRLHFDEWLAVAVTCGVAVNHIFVKYTTEILTDVPFFFGVTAAILGYEEILRATSKPASPDPAVPRSNRALHAAGATLLMLIGLVIAATMRPTFYVLAAAWGLACVWGLVRTFARPAAEPLGSLPSQNSRPSQDARPSLVGHLIPLALLFLLTIAWLFLTKRTRGDFFGIYELEALEKAGDLASVSWVERLSTMFDQHLPDLFLGTELVPGLNAAISLVVIVAAIALVRVRPLWGVFVAGAVAMGLLYANKPRYFLMVLPFLLIGWALLMERVSRAFSRWKFAPEIVLWLGLAIVWVPNTARSMNEVAVQHGLTRDFLKTGSPKKFIDSYRDGEMRLLVDVAGMIQRNTKPDQKVLGPHPRVLSYLSGRNVYAADDFIKEKKKRAAYQTRFKEFGFAYALFPADFYKGQEDSRITLKLMQQGFLHPGKQSKKVSRSGIALAPLAVEESPAGARKWAQKAKKAQKNAKPTTRPAAKSTPS